MNKIAIALSFSGLMLALAIAGHFDQEQETIEEQEYCYMTHLWRAEAARGVSPENRRGWPEFKPSVSCNK